MFLYTERRHGSTLNFFHLILQWIVNHKSNIKLIPNHLYHIDMTFPQISDFYSKISDKKILHMEFLFFFVINIKLISFCLNDRKLQTINSYVTEYLRGSIMICKNLLVLLALGNPLSTDTKIKLSYM